jgi:hypothetical protein
MGDVGAILTAREPRRMITADQVDFAADRSTAVVSGAQKFIIPMPAVEDDDGAPLLYLDGERAGQPVLDQQDRPIRGKGLAFFNADDDCYQIARANGSDVIIVGAVTEEDAARIDAKVRTLAADPASLSIEDIARVLRFVTAELGLIAVYNTTRQFVSDNMIQMGTGSGTASYGLHRRDDRDVCRAVYIRGSGQFAGPAATPQQFHDGAVIVKQAGVVRLIQPDAFAATYRHADGRRLQISELAVQDPGEPRVVGGGKR